MGSLYNLKLKYIIKMEEKTRSQVKNIELLHFIHQRQAAKTFKIEPLQSAKIYISALIV